MFSSFPYMRGKKHFGDYIHQDRVIRAAVNDCSADEFKRLMAEMYEKEREFTQDWQMDIGVSDMLISLILSVLCRQEKLKAFYEVRKEFESRIRFAEHAKYALLVSCLLNDDESAEYIIRNELDNSYFSPETYFAGPLYFLLITGKSNLVPAALERYRETCASFCRNKETSEPCLRGDEFAYPAASAAYFGDDDFLNAMFDSGYQIDDNLVIRLYDMPEVMEHLIRIYYEKTGRDKPVSITEFIKENFSTEKILQMGFQIKTIFGDEAFIRFTENMRPMKKTDRFSNSIIRLYYMPTAFNDTNGAYSSFLHDCAEKEITIVNDNNDDDPFLYAELLFPDHIITYDMTECFDDELFQILSNKDLKRVLQKNVIYNQQSIYTIVWAVLDRNNKQLTRLLLKKKMINKDNYEEILEYVVSERLLNSLAVLKNEHFS